MWKVVLIVSIAAVVIIVVAKVRNTKSKLMNSRARELSALIEKLENTEFFKFVKPEEITNTKQEILDDGFLFPESTGRYFMADAEDLAEQGVLEFLADISPFLEQQNVKLPVRQQKGKKWKERNPKTGEIIEIEPTRWIIDDSIPGDPLHPPIRPVKEDYPESGEHYRVTVGEFSQEIWNNKMTDVQYWEAGMCHTFLLVNKLLENKGSPERIYGFWGGGQGEAVFLTEEQYKIINEVSEIEKSAKPWKPYTVVAKKY